MMKYFRTLIFSVLTVFIASAQDDLVKKSSENAVESNSKYQFTTVIDLEATPVKNQASSESEVISA